MPASEVDAGYYLLCLKLPASISLRVGSLKQLHLKEGSYVYCGSARGRLSRRIARHLKKGKTVRWHIDYLTTRKDVVIEGVRAFPLEMTTECGLNRQVQQLPGAEAIARFGCSDCSCTSHLTFFRRSPLSAIRRL